MTATKEGQSDFIRRSVALGGLIEKLDVAEKQFLPWDQFNILHLSCILSSLKGKKSQSGPMFLGTVELCVDSVFNPENTGHFAQNLRVHICRH